ncbi:disease resistance protein RPV1-like [Eucalyptus grandis]|uniref:disease resistance protein RPV1-like n=1 Tax=Eucalyptus grandis TaxID=71139 RepID=UPI00192ED2C9|nr:disease resistance protein RPV1-like [Eucalyptus grandis]
MDPVQSLKLFSKHAFRRDSPLDKDMNQSNRAIEIAKGLPLALEVIGSLLCRTKKENWDGKLKEWEKIPPEDVLSKLKISYDALRDHEQRIFLDIACLFIGHEKDVMIYFWDDSRFFPKEAMDVLENMSLMKIDDNKKVWMHDLVRDLGREIVHQESKLKIEEQSRVWDPEEALGLLRTQKKKKKLEALRLRLDRQRPFAYEDFKRLPNLSLLEVCGSTGGFCAEESRLWLESLSNVSPTNEDLHLLPQLRWLSWHYIPPTFKITNFSMEDVVILDLSRSNITHEWQGWSHMKVSFMVGKTHYFILSHLKVIFA